MFSLSTSGQGGGEASQKGKVPLKPTKQQLKERCKKLNLKIGGTMEQLNARIQEYKAREKAMAERIQPRKNNGAAAGGVRKSVHTIRRRTPTPDDDKEEDSDNDGELEVERSRSRSSSSVRWCSRSSSRRRSRRKIRSRKGSGRSSRSGRRSSSRSRGRKHSRRSRQARRHSSSTSSSDSDSSRSRSGRRSRSRSRRRRRSRSGSRSQLWKISPRKENLKKQIDPLRSIAMDVYDARRAAKKGDSSAVLRRLNRAIELVEERAESIYVADEYDWETADATRHGGALRDSVMRQAGKTNRRLQAKKPAARKAAYSGFRGRNSQPFRRGSGGGSRTQRSGGPCHNCGKIGHFAWQRVCKPQDVMEYLQKLQGKDGGS